MKKRLRIAAALALLVTLVVVALLALTTANCRFRFDERCSRLGVLGMRIEEFMLDTGETPKALSELVHSSVAGWAGPYAKPIDLIDRTGEPFRYEVVNQRNVTFVLSAAGPDGQIMASKSF